MPRTPTRAGSVFTDAPPATDEFTRQRLLPRRLGLTGPAIAVGDVNGDGLPDVFIRGTGGQAGVLYLGQPDGSFKAAPVQPWAAAKDADDVGAIFFDATGHGTVDLFIAAGGVRHERGDPALNNRLYLNDGHGRFTLAPEGAVPAEGEAQSVVAAADFEGTGKPGLFVGGRLVPGHWPAAPRSFLYRNLGGKLVDATDELAPGLREVGMVTAAVWADVDGDGRPDLVLATEWGPVRYFHNSGHGLEDWTEKAGLAQRTGWWSALAVADLEGHGRLDIIAGNVGLNTKYHASRRGAHGPLCGGLGRQRQGGAARGAVRGRKALPGARAQQARLFLPLDSQEIPHL